MDGFNSLSEEIIFEIAKRTRDARDYRSLISTCKIAYNSSQKYKNSDEVKGIIFNNYKLSLFQLEVLERLEPCVLYKIPSFEDRLVISIIHCSRLCDGLLCVPKKLVGVFEEKAKDLGLNVEVCSRQAWHTLKRKNIVFCEIQTSPKDFHVSLCKLQGETVFLFSDWTKQDGDDGKQLCIPIVRSNGTFFKFESEIQELKPPLKYTLTYHPLIISGKGHYGTNATIEEILFGIGQCSLVCVDSTTLNLIFTSQNVTKLTLSSPCFSGNKIVIYVGDKQPSEQRLRNYIKFASGNQDVDIWLVSHSYSILSVVPSDELIEDFISFTGSGKTLNKDLNEKDFISELTEREIVYLTRSCRSKKRALEWLNK